jgi:hypothetical protein
MTLRNDHGPGQSTPGDGPWQSYAPPPRFEIIPAGVTEGRKAYELLKDAEGAAICASKLARSANFGFTKQAFALRGPEIMAAIEACRKSLDEAEALMKEAA